MRAVQVKAETGAELVNTVLEGSAISRLAELPPASVDLVFADPPYNLQLEGELLRPDSSRVDAVDEAWDKFNDLAAYDAFTRAWLLGCRRVLKPNGTLWVIGSYHNIFRVGSALQDLGFWILNDVVWRKVNPMPNFRGKRLQNAHETLIWAARDRKAKAYTFNYEASKHGNEDVQLRSDWLFPLCTGAERLKTEAGRKLHPTQKPEALLHRVLAIATRPGDVVLDPFFGTGTTGAVARRMGRHFIGIEQDGNYAQAARVRIAQTAPWDPAWLAMPNARREAPRVAFASLVETGRILPGTPLCCARGRFQATVLADGSIQCGTVRGSIHRVGAVIQGLPSCNGWTFWHVGHDGGSRPIDAIRCEARAALDPPR